MAACRAGVCGACRCTTEGEIERQSVMTLSAQDLERGWHWPVPAPPAGMSASTIEGTMSIPLFSQRAGG